MAALGVALFHFTNALPTTWFQQCSWWGWLGVEVFFVISGFVIPWSLSSGKYRFPTHTLTFLAKRLLRLHIPFLASMFVFLALWQISLWIPGFQGKPIDVSLKQLLLHPLLLNGILSENWLQPVYWTLAIEFQFYLLIAVLIPLLTGRPFQQIITLLVLLLLALVPLSHVWILPYLPLFVMGILVMLHLREIISPGILGALAVIAGVIGTYSLTWQQSLAGFLTALAIAFIRITPPRWLLFAGTISYSFYLVHIPIGGRVINLAKRFPLDAVYAQILAVILAMLTSVFAAWLFYHVFEKPAQRWSSKLRYRQA
jgi:peptidoglycan/LPS O-acetylase OafA/YrhL